MEPDVMCGFVDPATGAECDWGLHNTTYHSWSAAALARETLYTAEQWQHALNALGGRADELLSTVKGLAVRQGLTPYAAACVVLEATNAT